MGECPVEARCGKIGRAARLTVYEGGTMPMLNGTDNSGLQTISDNYSIIIPVIYDVGIGDMVDIIGTGILEVT